MKIVNTKLEFKNVTPRAVREENTKNKKSQLLGRKKEEEQMTERKLKTSIHEARHPQKESIETTSSAATLKS